VRRKPSHRVWRQKRQQQGLGAHVRAVTVTVIGGVYSNISEVYSVRVALRGVNRLAHVAVGTSDDDVEVLTLLAVIVGVAGGDRAAPKDTFDIGNAGRVFAIVSGFQARTSLKVQVERCTARYRITFGSARCCVIRGEDGIAHVPVCAIGSIQAFKSERIISGSRGEFESIAIRFIGEKRSGRIWVAGGGTRAGVSSIAGNPFPKTTDSTSLWSGGSERNWVGYVAFKGSLDIGNCGVLIVGNECWFGQNIYRCSGLGRDSVNNIKVDALDSYHSPNRGEQDSRPHGRGCILVAGKLASGEWLVARNHVRKQ
jgi:hypothetical protein